MSRNKLKTKRRFSQEGRSSPVHKQKKWFSGMLSILRNGGRVRRKVTKITEYLIEVEDD
jgi:hypothetical protein